MAIINDICYLITYNAQLYCFQTFPSFQYPVSSSTNIILPVGKFHFKVSCHHACQVCRLRQSSLQSFRGCLPDVYLRMLICAAVYNRFRFKYSYVLYHFIKEILLLNKQNSVTILIKVSDNILLDPFTLFSRLFISSSSILDAQQLPSHQSHKHATVYVPRLYCDLRVLRTANGERWYGRKYFA